MVWDIQNLFEKQHVLPGGVEGGVEWEAGGGLVGLRTD